MVTPTGSNAPAPWVPFTRAGCDVGAIADREHRPGEHRHRAERRHHQGVRHPLAAVTRRRWRPTAAAVRHGRAGEGADRLRRLRRALRPGLGDLRERAGRRAARRAGRLHRLQGPVRRAGDRSAAHRPAADDAAHRPARPADHRPVRPARLPRLRRHVGRVSLAYTAAMQEKGVPVTYAYISDAHDFHGVAGNAHDGVRPRLRRLRCSAQGVRRCVRALLQPARQRRASTSPTRCSSSPSTRATTSWAARRPRRTATASPRRATGPARSARSTPTSTR